MNLRMAAEKYEEFRHQNGLAQVAHQVRMMYVLISYTKLYLNSFWKQNVYPSILIYKYRHSNESIYLLYICRSEVLSNHSLILQVIQGLVYLNNFGTVNCSLSPDNILIDPWGKAKLYNYGLYYMTEAATAVSFPLGSVQNCIFI